MAQQQSDNFQNNSPKNLDNKTGRFTAGLWRPYNDVAEFFKANVMLSLSETQEFWVRSTSNANRADLYAVAKGRTTAYKVVPDIDLSNYYNITQINGLFTVSNDRTDALIESADNKFELYVSEMQEQSENDLLKWSNKIIPASTNDGSGNYTNYKVIIPQTINEYVPEVNRSGTSQWTVDYSDDAVASEALKKITHNLLTGEFTFPNPFYENEFVYAKFQGITGGSSMFSTLTVETYSDMLLSAIGNRIITIFVNQSSGFNDEGDFFVYYPTKGIAYLGIDFNYAD